MPDNQPVTINLEPRATSSIEPVLEWFHKLCPKPCLENPYRLEVHQEEIPVDAQGQYFSWWVRAMTAGKDHLVFGPLDQDVALRAWSVLTGRWLPKCSDIPEQLIHQLIMTAPGAMICNQDLLDALPHLPRKLLFTKLRKMERKEKLCCTNSIWTETDHPVYGWNGTYHRPLVITNAVMSLRQPDGSWKQVTGITNVQIPRLTLAQKYGLSRDAFLKGTGSIELKGLFIPAKPKRCITEFAGYAIFIAALCIASAVAYYFYAPK